MSERAKLTLAVKAPTPEEAGAPADKTRGWNVSAARAEKLKEQARDMRRNPTEAETALWDRLKDKRCGGFSFTRQVVMGSTIVDFACRSRWLVVETGGTSEAEATRNALSDRKLSEVGVRVLRFADDEVLQETDRVCEEILAELQKPFDKPRPAGAQHDRGRDRPSSPRGRGRPDGAPRGRSAGYKR